MQYFGGIFGTIAEIWFFTNKDISFGKKIAAIVGFLIVTGLILGLLAVVMWAEQVPAMTFVLLGLIEAIFLGCAVIWSIVSVKVKHDYQD